MKARVILLVSLILNVSLLGAWWVTTRPPSSKKETAAGDIATKTPATSQSRQRATRVVTEVKSDNFDWSEVESDDYRRYISNLRAVGCPEETIRDIIITDINKLYAGKIAALYPSPKDFKVWQTRTRETREIQRERETNVRVLEKEKHDLVKELLGVDLETEMAKQNGEPNQDEWRLGWLSPEKQEQVRALYEKYREQERTLFANGDARDPQNRAKFMALRAQREADLAQLLTPEEFQEYQQRNSWTARNMRDNLASFNPTESEFKKIFDLKKAFDDQFAFQRGGGDDSVRQQREQAQQQLDEQLRALLGDSRYKQYQLAQDDNYRNLYDFMQRNNLPTQMAETLNDVRHLFDKEKQNILSDKNLKSDEQTALLAALSQKTRDTLSQSLGSDFEKYQSAGGGGWLNPDATRRGGGANGGNGGRGGGRGFNRGGGQQ